MGDNKTYLDKYGLAVNWVVQGVRLELCFVVVELNVHLKEGIVGHIKEVDECVKIVQKVSSGGAGILFLVDKQLGSVLILWNSAKIGRGGSSWVAEALMDVDCEYAMIFMNQMMEVIMGAGTERRGLTINTNSSGLMEALVSPYAVQEK